MLISSVIFCILCVQEVQKPDCSIRVFYVLQVLMIKLSHKEVCEGVVTTPLNLICWDVFR